MRLHPGLNNNLKILQRTTLCHQLLRLDDKYKLPAGIIPLCNNSAQSSVIAMMPSCNAHGLDKTWAEPPAARVQEWFDTSSEKTIRKEPEVICPTTNKEVAYIASRVEKAQLAAEHGDFGFMMADASEEEVSEEILVDQGEAAVEQGDKAAEEQVHREPLVPAKKTRVLRRAVFRELVHPPSSGDEIVDNVVTAKVSRQQVVRCQTS